MSEVKSLKCRECPEEYDISPKYVCDMCFGPLEISYNWDEIKKSVNKDSIINGPKSIWRYKSLLPIDGNDVISSKDFEYFKDNLLAAIRERENGILIREILYGNNKYSKDFINKQIRIRKWKKKQNKK